MGRGLCRRYGTRRLVFGPGDRLQVQVAAASLTAAWHSATIAMQSGEWAWKGEARPFRCVQWAVQLASGPTGGVHQQSACAALLLHSSCGRASLWVDEAACLSSCCCWLLAVHSLKGLQVGSLDQELNSWPYKEWTAAGRGTRGPTTVLCGLLKLSETLARTITARQSVLVEPYGFLPPAQALRVDEALCACSRGG